MHGPGEVPDLLSPFLTSPEGQYKRFEVSALAIHTTLKARGLSPHQRRCRFTDEPDRTAPSLAVPVYSYNLCRRGCRAHLARRLCQCAPHFYGPLCECNIICYTPRTRYFQCSAHWTSLRGVWTAILYSI